MRSGIKEDDKHIPMGFGKEDVTILAVRKNSRYNKWLEKRFANNYGGKYVIIDESEVNNAKYQDTKIYRYIFDQTETSYLNAKTGINDGMNVAVSYSLKDRSTGKLYQIRPVSGAPTAVMREYLTKLEMIRKNNAK